MGRCGSIKRKKRGGSFKISPIQKMKKTTRYFKGGLVSNVRREARVR